MVILGVSLAGVLLVLILAGGALYQYVYLPNQALVTVDGTKISRGDYWKVRKLELLNQIAQYSQFAQFASGQQATSYQQLADQARQQLNTVESDPVDTSTLSQMVDDQVLLHHMGDVGVTVTDADIDQFVAEAFAPVPIASPTPTLGVDPTAAAWATATAEATPSPTPEPSETPSATPGTAATPGATPEASPEAGTPEPTATPNPEQARATATANFDQYRVNFLNRADMSVSDFRRLVARPQVAREKVQRALEEKIPTRAEQVHAAHILVATEEAAKQIVDQTLKQKDFAEVAKEQSSDSSTAANGGDLGWFPRGVMVKEFEDVAFSLKPGEVSQPVHTKFGWHIIKVIDHQQDRPLTVEMLDQLRGQALSKWMDDARAKASIEWHVSNEPTPTPTGEFSPPPDAPPTPTPTPSPTPAASPAAGTPEASPTP